MALKVGTARHSQCSVQRGRGESRGPGAAGGGAGWPLPLDVVPQGETVAFSRTCWRWVREPHQTPHLRLGSHLSSHGGGTRGETGGSAVLSHSLAVDSAGWRVGAGLREACTSAGSLPSVT